MLFTCFTEEETASSISEDNIYNVKRFHDSATDSQEKKREPENYVSSVRTVALCVRACCIFQQFKTLNFPLENLSVKSV